jgi:hypothetical protein
MRLSWFVVGFSAVASMMPASFGCSGGSPMGGPHGLTTDLPAPNAENLNTVASSAGGTDDGGALVGTTTSSGGSGGSSGTTIPNGSSSGPSSGSGTSSGGSSSSTGNSGNSSGSSGGHATGSSGGPSGGADSGTVSSGGSGSSSGGSSASSSGAASPVTWTEVYDRYLATGTIGNCTNCHGTVSPSAAFSFLQGKGYVGGPNPSLTNPSQSCLTWYGGNMPPFGPQSAQAVSDMNAWAAAGAKDN